MSVTKPFTIEALAGAPDGKRAPSFRSVFAALAAAGYDGVTIDLSRGGVRIRAQRSPAAHGDAQSSGPDSIDLAFGDEDDRD